MYACARKMAANFSTGRAHPDTRSLISTTYPPHNSRIVSPLPPVAASVRTGQTMYYQLRLLDPSNEASHKLIELVVEAVAYAVDVT
jgi:hypothetical protein